MPDSYLPILVFLVIACGLASVIIALPAFFARQENSGAKLEAYECGFEQASDARSPFHVRYYLVAILFVILDIEIIFLFPWAVSIKSIGPFGFWSMMAFLGVLTVGFAYEWISGALEWE